MRRPVATLALAAAPFWLGQSFEGLPLTTQQSGSTGGDLFVYGSCEAKPDSGCSPPLQVQNATTCTRNAVGLDVVPRSIHRVRGAGIAATYERGGIDVSTGRTTAAVYTSTDRRAARAVAALRRRSQSKPGSLPPPVFPPAVLKELKRVVVAWNRERRVSAVAAALGLRAAHVRTRLTVARLLPARALRAVEPPRRSWANIQRDRQVAFWAHEFGRRKAMEQFELGRAQVRRAVRRVRGLAGEC